MRHDLPFLLLDDSRDGARGLRAFASCREIIVAHAPEDVDSALNQIEAARHSGLYVAGYLSYELGYALEPRLLPLMPKARDLPLLWFGAFEKETRIAEAEAADYLASRAQGRAYAGPLSYLWGEARYARAFDTVCDYIRAGDIYQVNLTFPARFSFLGDALALYARLRADARAGHGAYIDDGERQILSLSPELFFEIADGTLTSRPMKGTAPRGKDEAEDAAKRNALRASEKERAENLMIVDLIRNDLGRVAKTGSVGVRDLFAVETYPTVLQMVSTVTASLRENVAVGDLAQALFPCGSVTGTPKIRAQEIIRECEPEPRGVYCGAIGVFDPNGDASFNVAIRTLTVRGNSGVLGIGGGIVSDSKPMSEYAECLVKARFYTEKREPLSLIETFAFDPEKGFVRLDLHLARLENSARSFGIPLHAAKVRDALAEIAGSDVPLRVRIALKEDGALSFGATALKPETGPWTYALAKTRMQSADPLLRHKTSWRAIYEDEYAARHKETGCAEIVFLNERGEVTEGSRSNIFASLGGQLFTPPVSSGLLPGILRQALLQSGECRERILTPDDLARAEKLYFGNSLRGLIEAVPV